MFFYFINVSFRYIVKISDIFIYLDCSCKSIVACKNRMIYWNITSVFVIFNICKLLFCEWNHIWVSVSCRSCKMNFRLSWLSWFCLFRLRLIRLSWSQICIITFRLFNLLRFGLRFWNGLRSWFFNRLWFWSWRLNWCCLSRLSGLF